MAARSSGGRRAPGGKTSKSKNKGTGKGPAQKSQREEGPAEKGAAAPTKPQRFEDGRAFVEAIFQALDPKKCARKLLESKDGLKVMIQFLEYCYGKPEQPGEVAGSGPMKFNFITLAARPDRELRQLTGQEEGT